MSMKKESNLLVLDLETQKTFNEVGRQNVHKLKVSVVSTYDYLTDAYQSYEEHEIHQLEERLKTVDCLIGFNIRRFDLVVLQPYLFISVDSIPVLDLLEEIEKVRGHRVSLQSVAQATIEIVKTGQGLEAVDLFKRGQMDKLKEYCENDVKLTKDVYEYGKKNKKVYFISNRDWKKYEIPIQWGHVETLKKANVFPTSLF
ncbi:MAG: helicase [Candidatus Omnitrophica bacterium CG11_big_fil_rev_8_21_14_0_20_45_26]|uniref:Helicase n=1 Tax=Candidatus Abzuiibacterium crystallinum TaxID=1974748 RepID=A0A2H0LQT6_9BACT|nr:MAG: helicase [Candidatus Omnitrophica bacterium CG11_big_fil_rev_8_21_14_0_20_45_26]PIW64249.1 MAG: helicase [Candidatus Omnitrophica bacterium CG12_big_fil_rev_8_21_14_0_65_45_16]